jgi:hypothetical protein
VSAVALEVVVDDQLLRFPALAASVAVTLQR